jgi:hypothetical protein
MLIGKGILAYMTFFCFGNTTVVPCSVYGHHEFPLIGTQVYT